MTNPDGNAFAWRRRALIFGCALLAMVLANVAQGSAQTAAAPDNSQAPHPPANVNTPHQLVLTGCLRRDSHGIYSLTNENGKTFNLIAALDSVDLSKHVFHVVRITGKEAPNVILPGASENSQAPSTPVMRVLTLEVLSNSCTR